MIVDLSSYGYNNPDDFVKNNKGKSVKCPNPSHKDKHPSAQVNETNIYCHTCSQAFFFKNDNEYKTQYQNNQTTAEAYYDNLMNARNSSAVRQYLQKRGLNENNIITEFQLGFKVDNNTLVFPIKNSNGYINGFGFRQIDDNNTPKYINSSSDDTFHKGNNLYGVDKITNQCEHLIICEGYICVLSAFHKGLKGDTCFVATMTSALSESHISLIKHAKKIKNIHKISLMFDNDDCGKKATLSAIKVLLNGGIIPNVIHYHNVEAKDIDEILQKENGEAILKTLINAHCYDFLDYLLKLKITDDELKTYIDSITDENTKSAYATKMCRAKNLYTNVKIKERKYDDILSLNGEEVRRYFYKTENYFNHKLPKYFKFQKVLDWSQSEVVRLNKSGFPFQDFKNLENVNYKLLGNKNGEYAWRQYQIINPVLYIKLVDTICDKWLEIQTYFQSVIENIQCTSMPVIEDGSDKFANNSARQIINWWDGMEQQSIKKSLEYRYVIHTDIVDCYGSIYTHSIAWALHGKSYIKNLLQEAKQDKNKKKIAEGLIGNKIDMLLQCMSHGQTNGIPQGSVLMDFIAEILLHYIDKQLAEKCLQEGIQNKDYYILRYRDDYRIFTNEVGIAKKVLKCLSEVLVETGGMRLSSEKTQVLDCVVSGSIKKDKLHYFEYFKEHDSIRNSILNIYLFAKKFPNSGSILRLLKSFSNTITHRINQISLSVLDGIQNDEMYDFDPRYVIGILSEIMYSHPRTYPLLCDIIYNIISIMTNDERKGIAKNIADKMKDVPNGELLRVWLERMTYIDNDDIAGWNEFYANCSNNNNKTLLHKGYNNEAIWEFSSQISNTSMPSILDDTIIALLSNAKQRIVQDGDVNQNILGPLTDDEIDIFYRYTD